MYVARRRHFLLFSAKVYVYASCSFRLIMREHGEAPTQLDVSGRKEVLGGT